MSLAAAAADGAPQLTIVELVVLAGAVTTALGIVGGAIMWLVRPRVEAWARELVDSVHSVGAALDDTNRGSTAQHAKQAALAVRDLPDLVQRVDDLVERVDQVAAAQQSMSAWREDVAEDIRRMDYRVGSIESAVLALMGPELRRRLDPTAPWLDRHDTNRDDDTPPPTPRSRP